MPSLSPEAGGPGSGSIGAQKSQLYRRHTETPTRQAGPQGVQKTLPGNPARRVDSGDTSDKVVGRGRPTMWAMFTRAGGCTLPIKKGVRDLGIIGSFWPSAHC